MADPPTAIPVAPTTGHKLPALALALLWLGARATGTGPAACLALVLVVVDAVALARWWERDRRAGAGPVHRLLAAAAVIDELRPASQARLSRALGTAVVSVACIALLAAAGMRAAPSQPVDADLLAAGAQPAQAETGSQPFTNDRIPRASTTPVAAVPSPAPKDRKHSASATAVVNPATRGALPVGKGMWIWQPERTEGNDVDAIVRKARAVGLTHLYVRTGSSYDGFYAQEFLDRLLPAAHANSLRVFGWDVPYLNNADQDVARAVAAIRYTTPSGHRIDGFSADIEIGDGQNVRPGTAATYGSHLREAVGPGFPLIATVPRPNPALVSFPFTEVVGSFDAIAPMVYWMGNEPAAALKTAVDGLSAYGKPIIPIGQAYDGASEGGPHGVPPRSQLLRFLATADALGAPAVSFWDWQEANAEAWDAIRDAPQGMLPTEPATFTPGQVRAYQTLLSSLGFSAPLTGVLDETAKAAIEAFQRAAHLPVTGRIDPFTRALMLSPKAPPTSP